MFKHFFKKATASFMTGAILLSLGGCLNLGGNKAVLEAADVLANDMIEADAATLIKNSSLDKKSKEATALKELLSDDLKSDDELAFYKAVNATIEYEIDEKSCSVSKGEASVDIVFTIADYDDVLKDTFTDIDSLKSAIKKADTKEVTFTAEFVKDGKEWIPDNIGSKKFLKLYDYRNAKIDLALTADMIAGFIDRDISSFWLTTDDMYIDTDIIEYDYFFNSAVYDYEPRGTYLYFNLVKDELTLYTSEGFLFGSSTSYSCRVDSSMAGYGSGELFESGRYTIELCMPDGSLVDAVSVEVIKNQIILPTGNLGGGGSGSALKGENEYYAFADASFRNYVIDAGWFDYDGCLSDDFIYSTDVQTIAFSMQVSSDCTKSLTYTYSYSDSIDENALLDALNNPVYTGTVSPKEYTNGYFYDIDYTIDGEAKPGYYIFIAYDSSSSEYIMHGFCYVS